MERMLKAIRDVPEAGIWKDKTRIVPDHELVRKYPDAFEPDPVRGSWRGRGPDPFALTNGQSPARSRSRAKATPATPKYDLLTELRVRDQAIAEMQEADERAKRADRDRRVDEFWDHSGRLIERLEGPRLDAAERRQQRIFDDAAALVADAEAAPVQRELDSYDDLWGGAGRTPWTSP